MKLHINLVIIILLFLHSPLWASLRWAMTIEVFKKELTSVSKLKKPMLYAHLVMAVARCTQQLCEVTQLALIIKLIN